MSKKFDYDGSFKVRVESVVRAIPRGHTQSYKEVAILAGVPQGARAVARIMARNYDLTIPCHRVIKSDGTLGGYNRGGEEVKRLILESEGWVR
ncbi:MAG: hypothetical protein RL097_383 [Candidatus Parcubacteria bacterium]|jgi:methylated-DNA-[protein]-cysteine S-methyltransferase